MRIRCSLHNHTQMSDGYFTVSGALRVMKEVGYDVVALTDHNHYTVPHPLQIRAAEAEDLLIIRGVEVTLPRLHIVCLEPIRTEGSVADVVRTSLVKWIAHPKYQFISPPLANKIIRDLELDGVELYNAGETVFKGDIDGHFFAVDDLHIPSQLETSWIEMDVQKLVKEEILENLKNGEFEIVRGEIYEGFESKTKWEPDMDNAEA